MDLVGVTFDVSEKYERKLSGMVLGWGWGGGENW